MNAGELLCRAARCFALFVLLPAAMEAQTYPLTWYRATDGLAQSMVGSIVQDSEGYLWCGTWNGVSRFDGNTFQNFNADGSALSHKFVGSMLLDSTGTGVWGAIANEGVVHIDRYGVVTQLVRMVDGVLTPLRDMERIAPGDSGSIWFSTNNGTVLHWRPGVSWREYGPTQGYDFGMGFWPTWYAPRGELWVMANSDSIKCLRLDGSCSTRAMRSLLPDVHLSGLWRMYGLTPNRKTGGIWIRTERGLITVDGADATARFFQRPGIEGFLYLTSCTDPDGNLWGAQRDSSGYAYRKFSHTDGSVLRSIGYQQEFSRMLAFGVVYEDREGSIWLGASGLGHVPSFALLNYRLSVNGIPATGRTLGCTSDGSIYLSTWSGIYRFRADGLAPPAYVFPSDTFAVVSNLVMDAEGTPRFHVWSKGSWSIVDGKVLRDRRTNSWTYHGKEYPVTEWMETLRDGTLLFPDIFDGARLFLVRPAGDSTSLHLAHEGKRDPTMYGRILATRHTAGIDAYATTKDALWSITGMRATRFAERDGYHHGDVPALCEDSTGMLWIGFRSPMDSTALLRFDGTQFRRYSKHELGIASNAIVNLAAHPNKRDLVISGMGSVSIVDLRTMRERRRLTEADGIPSWCGHLIIDRNNVFWISAIGEVTRYDEALDNTGAGAPHVVLSSLTTDTVTVRFPSRVSGLQFESSPERIEFKYSALSFTSRPVKFQTRIDGLNADWSAPTDERFVRYAHMDDGSYVFRVRAVDPASRWVSREARFAFRIPPPLYKTWWFLVGINLFAFGLIAGIYRYRLMHALRLEQMRSQIALDLHDEVSSMLTSISFLGSSASADVDAAHPAAPKLAMISDTARSVIDMISDIIWSLKPQNDSFNDLGKRLGDMAVELCEGRDIRLHIDIPPYEQNIEMRLDLRRHLYLVAKEAVHNALKHSHCTALRVSLQQSDNTIRLSVTDNGVGMTKRKPGVSGGTGTGMESMRKRAALAGATLEFVAPEGGGTTVRVTLHERARRRRSRNA